jgi:hypothetical protein
MPKLNKISWERFKDLTVKLIEYRIKTTKVPVRAESWEEIIYAVLLYMEHKVSREPTSHVREVDLEVKINAQTLKISAKAGKIKEKILTLSSYRLTRFGYLGDMLSFLKENAKEIDLYLICAREEKKNKVSYYIFKAYPKTLVPKTMLNPINWKETASSWNLQAKTGFEATIVKKMSNQLWYSVPLDFYGLERLGIIEITKSERR